MSSSSEIDISKGTSGANETSGGRISYVGSEQIVCPICEYIFQREEMHGGRGRIVVDKLTQELRHTYKPSEKYGVVNPLLYAITVCPRCLYAAFKTDFTRVNSKAIAGIKRTQNNRRMALASIFPNIDFATPRTLPEGIASYYYAMQCYQHWLPESGPSIKQAVIVLRIAWLCSDFHELEPQSNWDAMARIFYRKARYMYRLSWEQDQAHKEIIPHDFNLGPDTDKNYGIDGICYLTGYLEFFWGSTSDNDVRIQNLQAAKALISNIFSAKQERKLIPALILTNARNLHSAINAALHN